MGGARNLKLGGQRDREARARARGAIIFVWAKCQPYSVVCIKIKKSIGKRKGKRGDRGRSPLKLKHF